MKPIYERRVIAFMCFATKHSCLATALVSITHRFNEWIIQAITPMAKATVLDVLTNLKNVFSQSRLAMRIPVAVESTVDEIALAEQDDFEKGAGVTVAKCCHFRFPNGSA